MNILICTSEKGMDAGGLAFHCIQLKDIYESLGHTVQIEVSEERQEFIVVDGGYNPELGQSLRMAYMFKGIVNKYPNIDLCISCGAGKTSYYGMQICKKLNIPLYIVLCGSEINVAINNPIVAFYNTESLSYASKVIGLSNELIETAKLYGDNVRCKYYVVPNYYELGEEPADCEADKKSLNYVTGASYLNEKKGIANLLVAFSILVNDKKRNDKLYLYGKIDSDINDKYQELVRQYNLEKNVFFLGYLSREEFHKRMKKANVYIQASPFEGFGNSVAEAINMGKDIIISNTGYIAEQLVNEFSEHIFQSLSPKDMADKMEYFGNNVYGNGDVVLIKNKLKELLSPKYIVKTWNEILEDEVRMHNAEGVMKKSVAVMFHDIGSTYTGIDYAVDGFRKLLEKIKIRGYSLCSAREYMASDNKENKIICTFDDGYENVYKNALPIMNEFGYTATVYICPDFIDKSNEWNHKDEQNRKHLNEYMINELVKAGWEIGSHGMSHMNMLRLSEHEIEMCLEKSKEMLEKYGKVESFCYPYGSFNLFIKEKVKKYYNNAFSISVGGTGDDLYQITRMTPEEMIKRLDL